MNSLVVNLGLSHCHEVSDSHLNILSIVGFQVIHFHGCNLPIESVKDGHDCGFLSLSKEVQITESEHPGPSGSLSKEVEIRCTADKLHGKVSNPECNSLLPGHPKVLVMRGDMLSTIEINIGLYGMHGCRCQRMIVKIKGMLIGLLS